MAKKKEQYIIIRLRPRQEFTPEELFEYLVNEFNSAEVATDIVLVKDRPVVGEIMKEVLG